MSVQSRTNNSNVPFIRGGNLYDEDHTIAQDAARAAILYFGTVMAKVAATGLWTPFIDETALDGTAIPQGVYTGPNITAAALVAGNILYSKIIIGGRGVIDADQLVIEGGRTLDTVITVGLTDLRTVKDHLEDCGIFTTADTIDIDEYENT